MKYTIYSNKEDWRNLYKEFEIINDVYDAKIDIKKVKFFVKVFPILFV